MSDDYIHNSLDQHALLFIQSTIFFYIECKAVKRMCIYFVQNVGFQIVNYNREGVPNTFISTSHVGTHIFWYVGSSEIIAVQIAKIGKHIWNIKW